MLVNGAPDDIISGYVINCITNQVACDDIYTEKVSLTPSIMRKIVEVSGLNLALNLTPISY